jgi:hypothetical protein
MSPHLRVPPNARSAVGLAYAAPFDNILTQHFSRAKKRAPKNNFSARNI